MKPTITEFWFPQTMHCRQMFFFFFFEKGLALPDSIAINESNMDINFDL